MSRSFGNVEQAQRERALIAELERARDALRVAGNLASRLGIVTKDIPIFKAGELVEECRATLTRAEVRAVTPEFLLVPAGLLDGIRQVLHRSAPGTLYDAFDRLVQDQGLGSR